MSQTTRALPADWTRILDDVQSRLDHAVSRVNARIETLPRQEAESLAATRLQEIDQWGERLKRLHAYLESAEQVVQSVDEVLHQEVCRLKEAKGAGESLRRRLAEGTRRAIG